MIHFKNYITSQFDQIFTMKECIKLDYENLYFKIVRKLRESIFINGNKATHHYLFLFINHDASSSRIAKGVR